MRKNGFVTAALVFGAIGTGSAGALAAAGLPLPLIGHHTAHHPRAGGNAALAQYGHHPTITVVVCLPPITINSSSNCTARVIATQSPAATGTVSFSSSAPGTFAPAACMLKPPVGPISTCFVTYTPTTTALNFITGSYSGDAANAPSSGRGIVISLSLPGRRARI